MSISLVPAGIGVAGQNLISGFPPSCALWLRERMYFFVTVPARLNLGLPRRTALQGFARICVHSRAKICFPVFGLKFPVFFPLSIRPLESIRTANPTQPKSLLQRT